MIYIRTPWAQHPIDALRHQRCARNGAASVYGVAQARAGPGGTLRLQNFTFSVEIGTESSKCGPIPTATRLQNDAKQI